MSCYTEKEILGDALTTEKLSNYHKIVNLYPWLMQVRGNITEYETISDSADYSPGKQRLPLYVSSHSCSAGG